MEQRRPYKSGDYTGYGSHSTQESYYASTPSYSGMPGSNDMRGADIIAEYLVKEKGADRPGPNNTRIGLKLQALHTLPHTPDVSSRACKPVCLGTIKLFY